MPTEGWDAWNFRDMPEIALEGKNLVGFEVHATDGHIGKIDEATTEVGQSQIVVDTGPWIFGRKVVLPIPTAARDNLTVRNSKELCVSHGEHVGGCRLVFHGGAQQPTCGPDRCGSG